MAFAQQINSEVEKLMCRAVDLEAGGFLPLRVGGKHPTAETL